jgi:O-succinylbenzoate synthase
MALDRNLEKALSEVEVQVVKPAVQEMKSGPRVIVTSYMDHPLGQTFAAWEAARVKVKEICGLQTHGLFEANEFIEALGDLSPEFNIPKGTGLGFDDLLEALPWTKLSS